MKTVINSAAPKAITTQSVLAGAMCLLFLLEELVLCLQGIATSPLAHLLPRRLCPVAKAK